MSFTKTMTLILFAGLLLATSAATSFAQQSAPATKNDQGK
jgi:hypothetical protein